MTRIKKISGIVLIVFSIGANAQNDTIDPIGDIKPTISLNTLNEEFYLNDILNREFSRVLTSGTKPLANSATLSTDDDILSFTGNIGISKKSNLGIKVNAGATEGVANIISGGTTSPNVSLGLTYNYGIYSLKNKKYYDATQNENLKYSLDSLDIVLENTKMKNNQLIDKKKVEIAEAELKIKQTDEQIKKLNAQLTAAQVIIQRKQIVLDSLELLISKKTIEQQESLNAITILNLELKSLNETSYSDVLTQNAIQKRNINANKLIETFVLHGYTLNWLSATANINNRTFKHFIDSLPFDNQIAKKNFNNVELGLSWHLFKLTPNESFRTFYITIGGAYLFDDNFDELTKATLKEKTLITSIPSERTITKDITVYTGEYNSDITKFNFFSDAYLFLNRENTLAFHFNPNLKTNFKSRSKFDCRLGFMVGFQDKEKEKNIINIELFYMMSDMFKKNTIDEKFEDRTVWGLNLTFPLVISNKI